MMLTSRNDQPVSTSSSVADNAGIPIDSVVASAASAPARSLRPRVSSTLRRAGCGLSRLDGATTHHRASSHRRERDEHDGHHERVGQRSGDQLGHDAARMVANTSQGALPRRCHRVVGQVAHRGRDATYTMLVTGTHEGEPDRRSPRCCPVANPHRRGRIRHQLRCVRRGATGVQPRPARPIGRSIPIGANSRGCVRISPIAAPRCCPARRCWSTGVSEAPRHLVRRTINRTASTSAPTTSTTRTGESRKRRNATEPTRTVAQNAVVANEPSPGSSTAPTRPSSCTQVTGAAHCDLVAGPVGPLLNEGCCSPQRPVNASHDSSPVRRTTLRAHLDRSVRGCRHTRTRSARSCRTSARTRSTTRDSLRRRTPPDGCRPRAGAAHLPSRRVRHPRAARTSPGPARSSNAAWASVASKTSWIISQSPSWRSFQSL